MTARSNLARTAGAVLATLTALGVCLTTAGPAAANRGAVAAGHTISYVSPAGGSTCTLGFAFRRAYRTLGITGRCVDDGSGYIIDTDSGYHGRVVSYAYDPGKKGSDFALIDFGTAPVDTTLLTPPCAAVEAPRPTKPSATPESPPDPPAASSPLSISLGRPVPHRRAPRSCRRFGGPVWTRYGLDKLAIVGIWLETMTMPTPSTAGSTRCPKPSGNSAWPPTRCSHPPETLWRSGRSVQTSA